MLYERWRARVLECPNDLALWELSSGRKWTFQELGAASAERETRHWVSFPTGNSPEMILSVLRAWRHGQLVCPLESGQTPPEFPLPTSDMVHLKISSATSGPAKLIAFTAGQLAADAENIVTTMGLTREVPNVAFISLAHSYGFSNLITPLLLHGVPLVLGGMPLPESLRRVGELLPAFTLPAVPALWQTWHETKVIPPSVKLAISAGAPLPVALEQSIHEQSGLKVHNFYGASECGGIAYDSSLSPRQDSSAVGTPLHGVTLKVNAEGCLEVRGESVGTTYWPQSRQELRAGVYRTSDFAELVDGQVLLRGRSNDIINVAGRKVVPEFLEELLLRHPAVRDCLVFGLDSGDPQRGESIIACVESRVPVTPEAIRQHVQMLSESWQTPREIWFVSSLERNQRGKLSRADWRTRYLAGRKT